MANHAYVISQTRMPSDKQLDEFIQKQVRKDFPGFVVETIGPKIGGWSQKGFIWHLHHSTWNPDFFGFVFWISNTRRKGRKCIEFRHSVGVGKLGWWLELELRTRIAIHVNGIMMDDGTDERQWTPSHKIGRSYYDYLVDYTAKCKNAEKIIYFELEFINEVQNGSNPMPPDLYKWLGIPNKEEEDLKERFETG